MIHLGDITKINGAETVPVNVIIGGSPCQDLSVAGGQKGFNGDRSVLFMDQIRITKEMRAKYGKPRFMVWENVPGAFSSNKGADFGAVLTETVRIAEPKAPVVPMPKNGWPTAGCLTGNGVGGKWSVAWRVFDAQFWGVPQRRRRIALIADFGGESASEILFERESLQGNIEQSRPTRQTAPFPVEKSVAVSINNRGTFYNEKTETLRSESHGALPVTYCIQGNCIDRADTAGCNGKGWTEGVSYTLNTMDRPAVSFALENRPSDGRMKIADNNVVQTLCSRMGTGGNNTPMVFAIDRAAYNQGINAKFNIGIDENGPAYTVVAKGPGAVALTASHGGFMTNVTEGIANTLQATDYKDPAFVYQPCGVVRRLTPLECERLQGFPDGWTLIGEIVGYTVYTDEAGNEYRDAIYEYTDSQGKKKKVTDSARYKALGNSISLPNWFYVLQRLSLCCGADSTMASLFDGIGGFPLIWETLNGKGSCIWASEIEDFPIAVTKTRFPETEVIINE